METRTLTLEPEPEPEPEPHPNEGLTLASDGALCVPSSIEIYQGGHAQLVTVRVRVRG